MASRTMLIGEWHSGKSTLIRVLTGKDYVPRKVLALDYFEGFVNTPSEFLERRWYYWALINESADCDLLLFLHSAVNRTTQMAPGLATLFNRRVLGVVTQVDRPDANVRRARKFLANAGLKDIIEVSAVTGQGMDALRAIVDEAAAGSFLHRSFK